MSEQLTLPAEARDRAGKGASRALRRDGRVPAVVYGEKKDPLSIHVEEKLLSQDAFDRPLHELGHHDRFRRQAAPHAAQGGRFPPGHQPADPRRFPAHRRAHQGHVAVPVRFDNEDASPGLKRGGVLNVVQHELELICDAASIPDEIHISLEGLEIGDSIHISHVKLPDGVTPGDHRPRLHHRHHGRSVGDEGGRGRRAPADAVPTVEGEEGEPKAKAKPPKAGRERPALIRSKAFFETQDTARPRSGGRFLFVRSSAR